MEDFCCVENKSACAVLSSVELRLQAAACRLTRRRPWLWIPL